MAYDPSKDPLGLDPNNPNTQIINGNLYVWQPSTQGQDAQNYLGANADPSVVNQDTSPASGNGSWVPASYEHPNGQFWSLLAKVVAGTSLGEYGLSSLLGSGAAAGSAGAASGAGAGSTITPLTTTALGGASSLGLPTVSLPAAGGVGAAGAAGTAGAGAGAGTAAAGSALGNGAKTAATLPAWLKPAIAAAAPTIGKLTGGGSSDLTDSLSQALTSLIPGLKSSFDLGLQRQQQASPLYDAVLKMALGRLPNWSTGGGE
jgi:hypothetical protein